MSGLACCAYCGTLTDLSWEVVQQARRNGDAIFCDQVCQDAGEPFREKVTAALPSDTVRLLCRHVAGAVQGRCLDCHSVVR